MSPEEKKIAEWELKNTLQRHLDSLDMAVGYAAHMKESFGLNIDIAEMLADHFVKMRVKERIAQNVKDVNGQ